MFQRASKGVRLTGEGQLLYSYVEKGYEQISLGVEKVKQLLNLELGPLKYSRFSTILSTPPLS
mgnify:CR=1 FL=1